MPLLRGHQINQESHRIPDDQEQSGHFWEDPFPKRPLDHKKNEIKNNQELERIAQVHRIREFRRR
jgi:hypothetical protein